MVQVYCIHIVKHLVLSYVVHSLLRITVSFLVTANTNMHTMHLKFATYDILLLVFIYLYDNTLELKYSMHITEFQSISFIVIYTFEYPIKYLNTGLQIILRLHNWNMSIISCQ